MNAKRIFLSGIVATTCLAASAVIAAPRASGGSGSSAHFSGSSARFSGSSARFSGSPRFAGNRSAFARTSGVNSGHWHHHHGHVFFVGGFGYPYGYGYPWYDPYYYPYGYYDYNDYNRQVVYEGTPAYDDGLV